LQHHEDDECDDLNAMSHFVLSVLFAVFFTEESVTPNDPSSATRRTGRNDCNRDAPAGLDAMKGCKAWADRAHAVYENRNKPNPS